MMFDLEKLCTECSVPQPDEFIARCRELYSLLLEGNSKTNLTRISDEAEFWDKHVADSLLIGKFSPELAVDGLSIADIGCGAGFPSLVLASAYPQLAITAIDSIGKKTAFVESAGQALGLNNLTVVTGRSRELNRREEWRDKFDIVTARAVADAGTLFREAKAMPKRQTGRFIFYKTPEQVVSDLPQVTKFSASNGIHWQTSAIYELPGGGGKRQFLFSKTEPDSSAV